MKRAPASTNVSQNAAWGSFRLAGDLFLARLDQTDRFGYRETAC